jgi:guanine deaminase
MRRAIELSLDNVRAANGGPFGAVIVRGGQIVAEGTNQVTSTNDATAHAEIVAIRAACRTLAHFHLTGCDIYTSCEPCPMCLGAIHWAGIGRVYYAGTRDDAAAAGFSDLSIYEEFAKPLNSRRIPMTALLREEALAAFREWQVKSDRIDY